MSFAETIFIYLLIGAVVATANAMLETRAGLVRGAVAFLVAVPFWPIFAPFLLARPRPPPPAPRDASMESRIAAAEERLIEALRSLDGIAEEVLAPELERVRGLARALHTMAHRAAEMSTLLATPHEIARRARSRIWRRRPSRMIRGLPACARGSATSRGSSRCARRRSKRSSARCSTSTRSDRAWPCSASPIGRRRRWCGSSATSRCPSKGSPKVSRSSALPDLRHYRVALVLAFCHSRAKAG
jgi:hypothetical protein